MAHGFLSGPSGPIIMDGSEPSLSQQGSPNASMLLVQFLIQALRLLSNANQEEDRQRRMRMGAEE